MGRLICSVCGDDTRPGDLCGSTDGDCGHFFLISPPEEIFEVEKNNAPIKRGSVLIEAHKTINGARQDVYGSPEDSFKLIADYWTTYLRSTIEKEKRSYFTPSDVAMMMTLFKIARLAHGPEHKDGYVDGCGYLALAADMLLFQEGDK